VFELEASVRRGTSFQRGKASLLCCTFPVADGQCELISPAKRDRVIDRHKPAAGYLIVGLDRA
jgi:hypothetical protein